MGTAVRPETIDTLSELEQEMAAEGRVGAVEALREAIAALARPARGWLTTGQAAEKLSITIPTVKDWVRRGTLTGRQIGGRWWVSDDSVQKVLGIRQALAEMEEDGYPSEEEIYQLTKKVRRQMASEERKKVAG